jgi:hypothetical protein
MKYEGHVIKLESMAIETKVTVTNVRRKAAPQWGDYGDQISFLVPSGRMQAFLPGTSVEIIIRPKP